MRDDRMTSKSSRKPVTRTAEELNEAAALGTTDLMFTRWSADYPDSDSFASGFLKAKGGWLGTLVGTQEVDELTARARAELDPSARHFLYRQIEDILAREALLLPMFYEQVYRFARPEISGLTLSYITPLVAYENLQVKI